MNARPIRTVITVLMDILVVGAVALTLRLVVEFFGTLAATSWGAMIVDLTDWMVPIEVVESIKTPYGGVFDVSAAIGVVVLLLAEWVLSVVRARV